ncbi:DHS-like NAD/FAD-binding domain-containing protein [Hypoxylon trugodes]|uniref:DHS-like NAD/FAD-binding domain-containing protein n=1 Tax=Hypoxylon trugodes TaxID=326681 RepID=UPI00218DD5C2|nr:DHS-like NAD/FAD-binding domain-containing protein [Hypoxylon trugodes]KAI1383069.1 DHS-like NAD/FAD-binding domain-containing protein [Hypoxylon trugodes]
MANTAPKVAAEERQESPQAVDRKADALVKLIKKNKHMVVFTGAGISTSAGIPDFRGPEGIWTLRAQGRQQKSGVNTLQAVPTATHMALVELHNRGILKYLVSQNCDGLHRKSGISAEKISELHGNSNREYCKDCGKEYIRDFRAVASYEKTVHDHRTGRKCALCGGVLLDTIINFGESLFAEPLQLARDHAAKADLFLVLGSSLTVSPANEIPETPGRRKAAKLAICNLQDTPLDALADWRIHSKADELMVRVMEKLDIPIPPFILRRRLLVGMEPTENDRRQLKVVGIDWDGTPATFLHSVKLEYNRRVARSEPFIINFRGDVDVGTELKLELTFMGHYGEPNLEITYEYNGDDAQTLYLLEYNPENGEWKVEKQEGLESGDGSIRNLTEGIGRLAPPRDENVSDGVQPTPEIIEISD